MNPNPTLSVTQQVSLQRISDLLCNALEGGSNYWYRIEKFIEPKKLEFLSDNESAKAMERKPKVFRHLDYPLNLGGALLISDATEMGGAARTERLDLEACQRGLRLMAEKYPRHFADLVNEDDDACTGDVFLQLCLFGELVYG